MVNDDEIKIKEMKSLSFTKKRLLVFTRRMVLIEILYEKKIPMLNTIFQKWELFQS
jgi:hypothetical protein